MGIALIIGIVYCLLVVVNLRFTYIYYNDIYCAENESTSDMISLSFIPILITICVILEKKALFSLDILEYNGTKKYGFWFLDEEQMHCCYVRYNKLYKFKQYPDVRAKNAQKIFTKQMLILQNIDDTLTNVKILYNVNNTIALHNIDDNNG